MKNAPSFLSGCVVGALVSFILYFTTCYISESQQRGRYHAREMRDGVWAGLDAARADDGAGGRASMVLPAYSSATLAPAGNLILPVVFAARSEMTDTVHSIHATWGAQLERWDVAVGTKGTRLAPSSSSNDHLLLIQECEDFDRLMLSAEHLFCLLTSINKIYKDQYQWFLIAYRSTYVSMNRLVKILMELDPSVVSYIGARSSNSVLEMSELGLVRDEHFCRIAGGIVLSRAAMRSIVPHLQHCLGYGFSRGLGAKGTTGEVELGRCFSRSLGMTCSESLEVGAQV